MKAIINAMTTPHNIPENMDEVPIIDREHLELIGVIGDGADYEMLRELLQLFEEENTPCLDALREESRSGDLEGCRRRLHFMCGSSANLGLKRLSLTCRKYEQAVKEGRCENIEACLKPIEKEYNLGLQALNAELK